MTSAVVEELPAVAERLRQLAVAVADVLALRVVAAIILVRCQSYGSTTLRGEPGADGERCTIWLPGLAP